MQCTVGQLLDYIKEHKIPRDTVVHYQRIEDRYFEKHGWKGKRYVFEAWPGKPVSYSQAIAAFQPHWTRPSKRSKKRMLVIEAHY